MSAPVKQVLSGPAVSTPTTRSKKVARSAAGLSPWPGTMPINAWVISWGGVRESVLTHSHRPVVYFTAN